MEKTKICSKCGRELKADTDHFFRKSRNKDGLFASCKECEGKEFTIKLSIYKRCSKCKKVKLRNSENFGADKISKDGYRGQCKECNAKIFKEYRLKNLEKIALNKKKWRENNNKHVNAYARAYRKNNAEQFNGYRTARRTRVKQLKSTLDHNKWLRIKKEFDYKCAYCGITETEHMTITGYGLAREHFIPLDKGGEFSHDNIIPSCKKCNSSKFNKDFFEWYPTYEYYDKQREKFILKYLKYTTEDTQQLALFK